MIEPLPIGYIEVQRGWMGDKTFAEISEIIDEVRAATLRDYPHLKPYGARIERTFDGAGVQHATLYAGFEPRVQKTPPLNPNNLNEADAPQIGNAVPDFSIGMKEQKF